MPVGTDVLYNHTVHFESSGGIGGPADIVVKNDQALNFYFTVPDIIPTKENYTCMGWSHVEYSTEVEYFFSVGYTVNSYNLTLYPVWVYKYSYPKLNNVLVYRSDVNGVDLDSGTYASVSFDWESGGDVTDTSTIKISWKKNNETAYSTPISTQVSTQSGTFSAIIGNGTIDYNYAYDIKILIENDLRASTYFTSIIKSIPSQYFMIDFLDGGLGVAFGKAATIPGFDVNMNTYIHGTLDVDKQVEIKDTTATLISPSILSTLINGTNEFSTGIHTGKNGDNAASYLSHRQNGVADNSLWLEKDKTYFSKPVYISSLHMESITSGDPESVGIKIGDNKLIPVAAGLQILNGTDDPIIQFNWPDKGMEIANYVDFHNNSIDDGNNLVARIKGLSGGLMISRSSKTNSFLGNVTLTAGSMGRNATFYGQCLCTNLGNEMFRLDLGGKGYVSASVTNHDWGISKDFLRTAVYKNIYGTTGGMVNLNYMGVTIASIFSASDYTYGHENVDYGWAFQTQQYSFCLARVYTTTGDVGGWQGNVINTAFPGGFYFYTTIFVWL